MTLTSLRKDFSILNQPHYYSFLMPRIFISLILFCCTGVHAQETMYETMKRVIDVQEKVTELSSSLKIVTNVLEDASAIDDNTISNLKTAIIERQRCLSQRVMPVFGGIKCPTEPRTLGLLNKQLVTAIQMQKVGSIRLARTVLCLTAESYGLAKLPKLPKNVLPELNPGQEMLWDLLRGGLKEGVSSLGEQNAINQKCDSFLKRPEDFGGEFKTAVESVAERAWMYDTIFELEKSCPGGSVTDTDNAIRLKRALSYCNAFDREGAKTEAEAQVAIDRIKAQLRADEPVAAAQQPAIAYSNQPSSVWNGEYTCAQGITKLQLRTYNPTAANVPSLIVFSFGPHPNNLNIPSGEFSMTASATYQPGGNFNAKPLNWMRQPSGYFMVGLNGNFSPDMLQISGTVAGAPRCTTFRLQRARP